MRVMMIKGDPDPGAAPSEELLAAMGRYNDEFQQAGSARLTYGASPKRRGEAGQVRRRQPHRHRRAVPRVEQLIAGYWILQVQSMDEAVEWAKRAPFEALSRIYPGEYGATGEIEIRRVFELEGV